MIIVPSVGFIYKGFFRNDKPNQYGQIICVKNLEQLSLNESPQITFKSIQKFIQSFSFREIDSLAECRDYIEGTTSINFSVKKGSLSAYGENKLDSSFHSMYNYQFASNSICIVLFQLIIRLDLSFISAQ